MAWIDNIKLWTGLSVEESVRMTENIRDKWRKYVHGVASPRSRTAKEQEQSVAWSLCQLSFFTSVKLLTCTLSLKQ